MAPQDLAIVGAVAVMLLGGFFGERSELIPKVAMVLSWPCMGLWAWFVWSSGWYSTRGGRVHRDQSPGAFYLGLVAVPVLVAGGGAYLLLALP